MLQQSSLPWNKKPDSEFGVEISLSDGLRQGSKLDSLVTLRIVRYTIVTGQVSNLHLIDPFPTLTELLRPLAKGLSASLRVPVRADDSCCPQYSFTQRGITSESEILSLKLPSRRRHTFSVSIPSMSEPLNPERAHLNQLIAEEKLPWKSKVEDGLSWEQTATVFEEKFHRPLGSPGLEQRFNRLKQTKAQIAKVDLTLFVSSC
jgi:hypothetical protein